MKRNHWAGLMALVLLLTCCFAALPVQANAAGAGRMRSVRALNADEQHAHLNRGDSITLWTWSAGGDTYDYATGLTTNTLDFTYYSFVKYTVTAGKGWLKVDSNGIWTIAPNNTNQVRVGRIRISDRVGTVGYVNIRQGGKPVLKEIRQVGSNSIRLQFVRVVGASGYSVMQHVRRGNSYAIPPQNKFRNLRLVHDTTLMMTGRNRGYAYWYWIRPYKTLSGRRIYDNTRTNFARIYITPNPHQGWCMNLPY